MSAKLRFSDLAQVAIYFNNICQPSCDFTIYDSYPIFQNLQTIRFKKRRGPHPPQLPKEARGGPIGLIGICR